MTRLARQRSVDEFPMSRPCAVRLPPGGRRRPADARRRLRRPGRRVREGHLPGQAAGWGTVQFEGSDGTLKQSNIGSDGTYSVQGVATGEAKVAVSSINPKSADFSQRVVEGRPPPPPRPEVKGWFPIPEKYDTPFKSGLVYPIKSGPNTIDIELK